jgi:glycosyltransferase involved in cell wall biosynthesis
MRIAQVAPLAESVPPKLYGGTERVVSWLTEELVQLGHEVTLFASGDSATRAALVSAWPKALRLGRSTAAPDAALAVLLERVAEQATKFDVIHFHLDWLHLPLFSRLSVPFVTTLHGRLDLVGTSIAMDSYRAAPFVSISEHQRQALPLANYLGTVHHGMPADLLRPRFEPRGYLAFLGRLSPEKRPDVAIRLATKAGLPLLIAAKIPRTETHYFKERIEPFVDGSNIRFVGEVNDRQKEEFLGNAAALLFPIDWPEPFGLVMIEAMACGTPVVAFNRGSVPEIVDDGVSGFVVADEPEALGALLRIKELDRRRVRETFEQRFTARRMAKDYLRMYRLLASSQ